MFSPCGETGRHFVQPAPVLGRMNMRLKAYTVISKKKSHGLTRLKWSRDVSYDPGFDWPWVAEKVRRATKGRGRRRARASA